MVLECKNMHWRSQKQLTCIFKKVTMATKMLVTHIAEKITCDVHQQIIVLMKAFKIQDTYFFVHMFLLTFLQHVIQQDI